MHSDAAGLKPEARGPQARRSPSPRGPEGDDRAVCDRASPAIAYRVSTPGQALHDAVSRNDLDGVGRIIRASLDCIEARNECGRTSLHVAAQDGRNDIVKLLISHGANLEARSGGGYTPLSFAAESSRHDVVVTLLDSGADLEAKTREGWTPLHKAAQKENRNRQDLLAILMIRGADPNAQDKKGLTPMQNSVLAEKYSNARTLCALGADPSFRNNDGKNALDLLKSLGKNARVTMADILAKWEKCGKQTREILPKLSQFITTDGQIDKPAMLSWATLKGKAPLVEFILGFMAKETPELIESQGVTKGWRPIHHASWEGQSDVAKILLGRGAGVNVRTARSKWAPLHLAAERGRQRTLRVLLDNGADILAVTGQASDSVRSKESQVSQASAGLTAFWLAAIWNHPKTLDILGQYAQRLSNDQTRIEALGLYAKARDRLASLSGQQVDQEPGIDEDSKTDPESDVEQAGSEPSALLVTPVAGASGSFDGVFYSLPTTNLEASSLNSSYEILQCIWEDNFDFKIKRDRPIKVAVLDTGLDMSHTKLRKPRVKHFNANEPVWANNEPLQYERIKACKDFTDTGTATEKGDMKDVDGHGTQVSELILRLAPRADLYIARICEGDINRGTPARSAPTGNRIRRPQPDIVAKAIHWAREQNVDIINMSFGFHDPHIEVKTALKAARDSKILVFAAMSNGGNNVERAAWPARDPGLAIGVHSCDVWGSKRSGFTPTYVNLSPHNFMFVGEDVITLWPEAKGGDYRLAQGTSFATPAVAAMAALILGFAWQHMCKKEREEAQRVHSVDLDELRELGGMGKVLGAVSKRDQETSRYSYIHPQLLWKNLSPNFAGDKRRHAWDVLVEALKQ